MRVQGRASQGRTEPTVGDPDGRAGAGVRVWRPTTTEDAFAKMATGTRARTDASGKAGTFRPSQAGNNFGQVSRLAVATAALRVVDFPVRTFLPSLGTIRTEHPEGGSSGLRRSSNPRGHSYSTVAHHTGELFWWLRDQLILSQGGVHDRTSLISLRRPVVRVQPFWPKKWPKKN